MNQRILMISLPMSLKAAGCFAHNARLVMDPEALAARLVAIPGVVEHGLFLGLATTIVIAGVQGVRMIGASA